MADGLSVLHSSVDLTLQLRHRLWGITGYPLGTVDAPIRGTEVYLIANHCYY